MTTKRPALQPDLLEYFPLQHMHIHAAVMTPHTPLPPRIHRYPIRVHPTHKPTSVDAQKPTISILPSLMSWGLKTGSLEEGVPQASAPAPYEEMFRKQIDSRRRALIRSVRSSPSPCTCKEMNISSYQGWAVYRKPITRGKNNSPRC